MAEGEFAAGRGSGGGGVLQGARSDFAAAFAGHPMHNTQHMATRARGRISRSSLGSLSSFGLR